MNELLNCGRDVANILRLSPLCFLSSGRSILYYFAQEAVGFSQYSAIMAFLDESAGLEFSYFKPTCSI